MTDRHQKTTYITMSTAVRQSGLSFRVVRECVSRRLIIEPLTDADLAELRRIRRLQELGVNLQGIEIILHMRRRIQALQTELDRWQRFWDSASWAEVDDLWQRRLPWEPDKD